MSIREQMPLTVNSANRVLPTFKKEHFPLNTKNKCGYLKKLLNFSDYLPNRKDIHVNIRVFYIR
jgi:hypothetical protein